MWAAAGLLALAGLLLALSFAPWGSAPGPAAVAAKVIRPATAAPPPTHTPADDGRVLFGLKGCATCHRHDGIAVDRLAQGGEVMPISQSMTNGSGAPDLTDYDPDPDFVRAWLRDPAAVRPGTLMPNLGLSEDEITALLAFLEE